MADAIEHDKTPDEHSRVVGGSSAGMMINCPASYTLLGQLQAQLDEEAERMGLKAGAEFSDGEITEDDLKEALAQAERVRGSLNESSSYADEGTGLHEVLAYLVDNDIPNEADAMFNDPMIDELFAKYELDEKRFFDAVLPAYREFNKLCDELLDEGDDPENDELLIRVEARCEMPGIDGAFGTTDILIRGPKRTVVWDWKFGAGVPVYASYKGEWQDVPSSTGVPDKDSWQSVLGNDQLMFYARAARHTFPEYFDRDDTEFPMEWPVTLVICQPRIGDGIPSRFDTTVLDLEDFRLELIDAVTEATAGSTRMKKGSWCRFAKCKSICPLHMNAPGQLAELGEKLGRLKQLDAAGETESGAAGVAVIEQLGYPEGLTYAEALGAMLDIAEIAEPYLKEAQAQAHAFMEAGGTVPGHKLVPKKAGHDGWLDEQKVDSFLGRQGLAVEERRVTKPITPAVARTKLKGLGKLDAKGQKLLDKYVRKGVSSGTTIARSDDPRDEVLATSTTIKMLAEKIGSLAS